MGAYGYQDTAIKGLAYDAAHYVESAACAEAAGIAPGEPVFSYKGDENKIYKFHQDTGKLVFSADFVASNVINLNVNGVAISPMTFATSHAATAALLVAAITALAGVECVLDTTDVNSRTFLIQVKGQEAAVTGVAVTGGASQATGSVTYDSSQIFAGVAMFDQKSSLNNNGVYDYQEAVSVLRLGKIWVEAAATVSAGLSAFLKKTATIGSWVATAGQEIGCVYRSNAVSTGLAVVEVGHRVAMTYATTF